MIGYVFFFTTRGLKLPRPDRNCGNEGAEGAEMMRTLCQSVSRRGIPQTRNLSPISHFLYFSTVTYIFKKAWHSSRTKRITAVIALLVDFNGRWPVMVNSVCAVSVTLSSHHLFSTLLKAQQGCDCSRDQRSVLTAPLCCFNNTVQLDEVRQGAKVQFTYGTRQHKSLWFTEKGHELIIT